MSIIVQVCTSSGKIIESARWEIESSVGVQIGHVVAINIPFNDPALHGYLKKYPSSSYMIDKGPSGYSVGLSFQVQQIRHMIETGSNPTLSTMATVHPQNRLVENITTYLLDTSKCDPKFIHGVRGDAKTS